MCIQISINQSEDETMYSCCCHIIHVERGAKIIGILGMISSGPALLHALAMQSSCEAFVVTISFFIYMCIILAQRNQKPALYLPFLILNAITIALIGMYIGLLYSQVPDNEHTSKADEQITDYLTKSISVCVIYLVLTVWFQRIVYRAYKYMKLTKLNLEVNSFLEHYHNYNKA